MPPVEEKKETEDLSQKKGEVQDSELIVEDEEDELESESESESEIKEKSNESQEEEEERTFLNPNELPPELKPAFKKMQASFTRAMQGIAGVKEKAKMFDMFSEDPKQAVRMLAAKVGMQVADGGTAVSGKSEEESETTKYIRKIVREELAPGLDAFRKEQAQIKVQSDIAYLDSNFPDWYLYEDTMADLVSKHPTLRNDLDSLYEIAKTQSAKGEMKQKAAEKKEKILIKKSSGRGGSTEQIKAGTVWEAFQAAKRSMAK